MRLSKYLLLIGGSSEAVFASDANDPRLEQGVDEAGDAVISSFWVGTFFDGTREQ